MGISDGDVLGTPVGTVVGSKLGWDVGSMVGPRVGSSVGLAAGPCVGCVVGCVCQCVAIAASVSVLRLAFKPWASWSATCSARQSDQWSDPLSGHSSDLALGPWLDWPLAPVSDRPSVPPSADRTR